MPMQNLHFNYGNIGQVGVDVQNIMDATFTLIRELGSTSTVLYDFIVSGYGSLPERPKNDFGLLKHWCGISNFAGDLAQIVGIKKWGACWLGYNTTELIDICLCGVLKKYRHLAYFDFEHGTFLRCLSKWSKIYEISVEPLPFPSEDKVALMSKSGIVEAIVNQFVRSKARCLFLSHITFRRGIRLPVQDIVAAIRKRRTGSLIIIDGAHSVGQIWKPGKNLPGAVYLSCVHKWLGGPQTLGFMLNDTTVAAGNVDFLCESKAFYIHSFSYLEHKKKNSFQTWFSAANQDEDYGTISLPHLIASARACKDFIDRNTSKLDTLYYKKRAYFIKLIREIPGDVLRMISPTNPEISSGIVVLQLKKTFRKWNAWKLQKELEDKYGILVRCFVDKRIRFCITDKHSKKELKSAAAFLAKFVKNS